MADDFRPLPKDADGHIDREYLRHQFMHSKAFTVADFAREFGYDYKQLKNRVAMKSWREEKLADVVYEANEEAMARAAMAKKGLLLNQLKAVETLAVPLLNLHGVYQVMVKKHADAAARTLQDELSGANKADGYKAPALPTPQELAYMSAVGRNLTSAIKDALFLQSQAGEQPAALTLIKSLDNIVPEDGDGTSNQRQVEVAIKGMTVSDPRAIALELKALYDPPQALPAPRQAPPPPSDEPKPPTEVKPGFMELAVDPEDAAYPGDDDDS